MHCHNKGTWVRRDTVSELRNILVIASTLFEKCFPRISGFVSLPYALERDGRQRCFWGFNTTFIDEHFDSRAFITATFKGHSTGQRIQNASILSF
jgi:hypothetical protein